MIRNSLFPLIFLLIPQILWAINSEDFEKWGMGIVVPHETSIFSVAQPLDFPTDVDIPIYDQPSGKMMGHINNPMVVSYEQDYFPCYTPLGDTFSQTVHVQDYIETGYETGNLIYFDEKNGYLQVLTQTLGKKGWIKIADIDPYGFQSTTWYDIITQSKTTYYENTPGGLNMRKGPSTDHEKIIQLKGENYIIQLTGKTEKFWAEVKVTHYPTHPCEGGTAGKSWQGWIKFLDDKGFPNIWYYTRGC